MINQGQRADTFNRNVGYQDAKGSNCSDEKGSSNNCQHSAPPRRPDISTLLTQQGVKGIHCRLLHDDRVCHISQSLPTRRDASSLTPARFLAFLSSLHSRLRLADAEIETTNLEIIA